MKPLGAFLPAMAVVLTAFAALAEAQTCSVLTQAKMKAAGCGKHEKPCYKYDSNGCPALADCVVKSKKYCGVQECPPICDASKGEVECTHDYSPKAGVTCTIKKCAAPTSPSCTAVCEKVCPTGEKMCGGHMMLDGCQDEYFCQKMPSFCDPVCHNDCPSDQHSCFLGIFCTFFFLSFTAAYTSRTK